MLDGGMLAKMFGQELEGETESGEDRAQGDEFALGTPGVAAHGARFAEKPDQSGDVGQIDARPVDGQHAPDPLPAQRCGKLGFKGDDETIPEDSPETESQLISSLAERLFTDASLFQARKIGRASC